MIDYEKLKLAHQLLSKITDKYYLSMYVRNGVEYTLCPENEHEYDMDFDNLDLLIAKIKELSPCYSAPPPAKYKKGQEVWLICFGECSKCTVEEIYWDNELQDYRLSLIKANNNGKASVGQEYVHETLTELIENQISFWCSKLNMKEEITYWAKRNRAIGGENPCDHLFVLLTDDPECIKCGIAYAEEDCEHENDGMVYCSNPPQNKCKKCGEFYR